MFRLNLKIRLDDKSVEATDDKHFSGRQHHTPPPRGEKTLHVESPVTVMRLHQWSMPLRPTVRSFAV